MLSISGGAGRLAEEKTHSYTYTYRDQREELDRH